MKEGTQRWMRQAGSDLRTAKYLFDGKFYMEASFYCQQCAEKALKAVMLETKGDIRKIHDLVALGKDVNLPEELLESAKELTMTYIYSRYPIGISVREMKTLSSNFIQVAGEVLKWAEKQL
ncbi:MAG: HEPN domain-containing protein [Candidatus Tectomicrobia bacterium]|uniref:HEPN domain-containing protein n=1 Tax=Tectimicrobiota bacterium TaxID=2528274 RepID=A0A932I5J1_UNCTE|nr:HEPN domain-containing protein [Candidatus Tectomicrobia bacterium]